MSKLAMVDSSYCRFFTQQANDPVDLRCMVAVDVYTSDSYNGTGAFQNKVSYRAIPESAAFQSATIRQLPNTTT